MTKRILISEGIVQWAKITKPADDFGNLQYSLELHITPEELTKLVEQGYPKERLAKDKDGNIKRGDNNEYVIKLKKPGLDKYGNTTQLTVIDAAKKPLCQLIGNGSRIKVAISLIPFDNKFGKGISVRLVAVQVLDLIPYTQDAVNLFNDESQPLNERDIPPDSII